MTRILVVGAGGVGGLLAARLSTGQGVEVSLAVRRPTPDLVLERDGVRTRPEVRVVEDPAALDRQDWVVVATKAYDLDGVGAWLRAPACAQVSVVVAQNGLEHVQRMAPYVAAPRVVPMIVTYGAERRAPGHVVETLSGATRVPATDAGRAFAAVAAETSLVVEVVAEFDEALWTKLVWNLVGNSLTALADVPVREVAHRRELRELGHLLVQECTAVALARGVCLSDQIADDMMRMIATYPATVHTSMWQDLHAGRRLEHQAISGAVVRAAGELGIEVPHCRRVTALLEAVAQRRITVPVDPWGEVVEGESDA